MKVSRLYWDETRPHFIKILEKKMRDWMMMRMGRMAKWSYRMFETCLRSNLSASVARSARSEAAPPKQILTPRPSRTASNI